MRRTLSSWQFLVPGGVRWGGRATEGGFSRGAKDVARIRNVTPITLIDGDRLADLLIECEIGVRRDSVEVVTLNEESLLGGEVA